MGTQVLISPAETTNSLDRSKRFYRPELDVLRFGAFLLVFVAHTLPSPDGPGFKLHLLRSIRYTGSLGVPVFFLLSAYLITELLLRERDQIGDINISAFYVRRMLRIWPLYFFMLFATAIAGFIVPAFHISGHAMASYLLLSGNWYTLITGNWLPLSALPLWSIGIEEQFYLVWPSLVRYAGRRGILAASGVLWLSSQVALWILCTRHVMLSPVVWVNSFTHFQYFAIGACLSVILGGRVPQLRGIQRAFLALAGLCALFFSEFVFNVFSRTDLAIARLTIPGYLFVAVGTAMLFLSFLGMPTARRAYPFVNLGKISYGLYVYHGICVHFAILLASYLFHLEHARVAVAYLVGMPLSILVSKLSYTYFETPFLRLKERFTVVKSRSI